MKVSTFNGGLSKRLDPSLIAQNEATIYNNIDSDKGILQNTKDFTDLNIEARGYFHYFNGQWVSSYLERSYAEYNNVLYCSEYGTYPKKICFEGGSLITKRLGIVAPASTLTVKESAAQATYLKSFSVASNSAAARGLYITSDGYYLYTLDESNDAVDWYQLSTPWDIETAIYKNTFSIAAKETNAMGLTFKSNGTKFYIIGNNKAVYEYTMSVAWDITTAVYSTFISVTTQNTTPQDVQFSDDGTKMYTIDATTNKVFQYTLGTAFTVSSATYASKELDIFAKTGESNCTGLFFKPDGLRMYVSGYFNDKIYEFTLETAWDLSTAVYYGVIANIVTESTQVTGVTFSPDMLHMYIITDPTASSIAQYDINRISSASSTLQYLYTYYNSKDDVESAPSEVSTEFNVKQVRSTTLSGFVASDDPQVDKIRIYRIGDNLTTYNRVAEIGLPSDYTTYTYVDKIPTTDLMDLLTAYDNTEAPEGLMYLVEAYGKLFGAVANKLFFTKTALPDAWPNAFSITFSKNITGLLPTLDGLLVFMEDHTDILLGTSESDFTRRNISREQGCTRHLTANYVQAMPIWQSKEGFCTYSGGNIRVVSKDKLGTVNYNIINSAVFDETYFACLSDGSLLAFDVKFDKLIVKTFTFSSILYNLYAYNGILYGCFNVDRLCSLFTGSDIAFDYKSPVFTDDDHSNIKTYNNIYVRSNGTFSLEIFVDEELVSTVSLVGNTTHDIKVPQTKQKGYNVQFRLTGIGKVYEYEYKVMGRQNGR